ncbi:MAG: hypothetical protein ACREXR_22150, partial [Gammaproteobacteria bacterium]
MSRIRFTVEYLVKTLLVLRVQVEARGLPAFVISFQTAWLGGAFFHRPKEIGLPIVQVICVF